MPFKQGLASQLVELLLINAHNADSESLIKDADKTMYRVKQSGKNDFRPFSLS